MANLRVRSKIALSLKALCFALLLHGFTAVFAQEINIRAASPDQYVVVKGDTLWDIAGTFLEEPWMWPQVWQINPEIENPDLIYPGDVIELVYIGGSPVLRLSRSAAPELPTVRYSPRVRSESILSPIPAISLDDISSFLSKNSVLAEEEYKLAPYVLAEVEGRKLISEGNEIFGRGSWLANVNAYDIVRKGNEFTDPDTGDVIGVEGITVGTAELEKIASDKGILVVLESYQEIKSGDRLIPRQSQSIESRYLPAPPDFDVNAAIISIGSGKTLGGLYDTLILNRGTLKGLNPGHILSIRQPNKTIVDEHGPSNPWEKLKQLTGFKSKNTLEFPGETIGTVLIYRVFDDTSLGLVIKSSEAIHLNDRVATP